MTLRSENTTVLKLKSCSNCFYCTKGQKFHPLTLVNGKAQIERKNIFTLCIFFMSKWLSMENTEVELVMNTLVPFVNLQSNVCSILRKILLGWMCPSRFAWSWTGVSFLPLQWNIKLQFTSKFAVYSDINILFDTYKHFQTSGKQVSALSKV